MFGTKYWIGLIFEFGRYQEPQLYIRFRIIRIKFLWLFLEVSIGEYITDKF